MDTFTLNPYGTLIGNRKGTNKGTQKRFVPSWARPAIGIWANPAGGHERTLKRV